MHSLVMMYAPNKWPIHFLKLVMAKVHSLHKGYLVICWNFNAVPDSTVDTWNPCSRLIPNMVNFLHANALYDVWWCHHTTDRGLHLFLSVHNTYTRIDCFLVDKWLLQKAIRSDIKTITWSDNAPTIISFSNPTSQHPTRSGALTRTS